MYKVTKRDGRIVDFNITRIANAMTKAFEATEMPYTPDIINLLSLQVTADYACKVMDDKISVESIQDSVEAVLERAGIVCSHLQRKQVDDVRRVGHFRCFKRLGHGIGNTGNVEIDYSSVSLCHLVHNLFSSLLIPTPNLGLRYKFPHRI